MPYTLVNRQVKITNQVKKNITNIALNDHNNHNDDDYCLDHHYYCCCIGGQQKVKKRFLLLLFQIAKQMLYLKNEYQNGWFNHHWESSFDGIDDQQPKSTFFPICQFNSGNDFFFVKMTS